MIELMTRRRGRKRRENQERTKRIKGPGRKKGGKSREEKNTKLVDKSEE